MIVSRLIYVSIVVNICKVKDNASIYDTRETLQIYTRIYQITSTQHFSHEVGVKLW